MSRFIINKEDISIRSTIKCISHKTLDLDLEDFISSGCQDMEEYFDNCPEDYSEDDTEVDEHEEEWSVDIPGAVDKYYADRKRIERNNKIERLKTNIRIMIDEIDKSVDYDMSPNQVKNQESRLIDIENSLGEMVEV